MANDVRLIDAKALCKGINESIKLALEWENEAREMKDTHGVKYAIATQRSLLSMMERVLDEPTIDAQSVKHGKWEHGRCTECGKSLEDLFSGDFYYDYEEVKFCPNCGAKMDGEANADS